MTEQAAEQVTEQATEQTTADALTQAEPSGDSWLAKLPEEYRNNQTLSRFKSEADLAKSYLNADKLISEKNAVPSDDAPQEVWDDFYNRLGRPMAPSDYDVAKFTPEGVEVDQEAAEFASKLFHEAGLTRKQAEKIVSEWNKFALEKSQSINGQTEAEQQKAQAAQAAKIAEQDQALKNEWGGEYDNKMALAQRALKSVANSEQEAADFVNNIGGPNAARVLERVGRIIGEDRLTGDLKHKNFGLTPQEISSKISELQADPLYSDVNRRTDPRRKELLARISELHKQKSDLLANK